MPSGPAAADQKGYPGALPAFGQPDRALVVFYIIGNRPLIVVLLREQPLSQVVVLLVGSCAKALSALAYTGLPCVLPQPSVIASSSLLPGILLACRV